MREVLITSSVLILALLVLRLLFRKTISRRVQYALWALVLARLLVPVNLPAIPASVLSATPGTQTAVTRSLERELFALSANQAADTGVPAPDQNQPGQTLPGADQAGTQAPSGEGQTAARSAQRLTVGQVLTGVWMAGVAVMACFFLATNLRFWRRLRKHRTPYPVEGVQRPVYLCAWLRSPCLFGLLRPAIYLTPAAIVSPESLRHVLAHEETHARHLDPLWSLLRCVCLTVYWFDPLVWAAAWASRTDCELSCDEGALRRLGDDQRLPYGKTLLSLIPVRRGPSNPLLSATTMAAGKRQLRERITRIAEKRRTITAALIAAVALVLAVSACTFTGGKATRPQPLTGAELAYFNGEYFNGGDVGAGERNIRNQFLSSLYEKPGDMDLFALLYCEGAPSSGEENLLVYGQAELESPAYKLTTAQIDALLSQYTGLTLAGTNQVGMENFTYLADFDAYYWSHGDTNYRSEVNFSAGEREGDTIRLYYDDLFMGDGWKCLTLEEQKDGAYHFVSNQTSEKPAIPTVLPEGKPERTIGLDGLAPYETPALTLERRTGDCAERLDSWSTGDHVIQVYRSTDGNLYAAVDYAAAAGGDGPSEWDVGCFLTLPDGYYSMSFFSDLFGHDGIRLSYSGQVGEHEYGTIHDYYYVTGDATPVLLARATAWNESYVTDLDGDGTNELACDKHIFFQREGTVYRADLPALLTAADPALSYWDASVWDTSGKCLTVTGLTDSQEGELRTFWRYLYFDGEHLLVYRDTRAYQDHVMEGIDAPAEVIEQAKRYVLSLLESQGDGTWLRADRADDAGLQETYDDWRIERLSGPYRFVVEGITVDAYCFNYEMHTTTPEKVVLAGGKYLSEDNWVSPGYPNSDYLFFHVMGSSGPAYLYHSMINDMSPDSDGFSASVASHIRELGLLSNTPGGRVQAVLDQMMAGERVSLTLATASGAGGGAYTIPPSQGNGPNRVNYATTDFDWSFSEGEPAAPQGADSLTVALDGDLSLQFWAGSELVRCTDRGETLWLLAKSNQTDDVFSTDIFHFMRFWYDEAEWEGLTGNIVIPNAGQSRQEIAQAWVDAHEGAMLQVTPGGKYACTYVKSTAGLYEDTPEGWFPEEILKVEHFAFFYNTVFVPENERAGMYMMAGNTTEAEEDGAPNGAFAYGRSGSMYLTDAGWRCHSIGTG